MQKVVRSGSVRRALNQQVVDIIGRRIVGGEYRPGTILPTEEQIGKLVGASRPVVREAMKILATKGLVDARSRRGTQVAETSGWNVFDPDILAWWPRGALKRDFAGAFSQLRQAIEPIAAELAAQQATAQSVAALRAAYEAMTMAEDSISFTIADVAYHRALFHASGNILFARLSTIVEPLLHAVIDREEKEVPTMQDETIRLHAAVVEAIERRAPADARRFMEQLIVKTVDIFRSKGQT